MPPSESQPDPQLDRRGRRRSAILLVLLLALIAFGGGASTAEHQCRDHAAPRRVGVMGGTFDPIHHGHLVAASEVQAWFDLDEVVFVPTGDPWQKSDRTVSPAEHRYLMTVIATAANPRFTVSRVDIDRGGPTYTIDTLRDLRAAAARRRALLHHRRRRAGRHLHLARRRRAVRAGPLRRAAPGPATTMDPETLGQHPRRPGHHGRDPGAGDLLDRLPRAQASAASPSGTSCPTASSSTSPSTTSTPELTAT